MVGRMLVRSGERVGQNAALHDGAVEEPRGLLREHVVHDAHGARALTEDGYLFAIKFSSNFAIH